MTQTDSQVTQEKFGQIPTHVGVHFLNGREDSDQLHLLRLPGRLASGLLHSALQRGQSRLSPLLPLLEGRLDAGPRHPPPSLAGGEMVRPTGWFGRLASNSLSVVTGPL